MRQRHPKGWIDFAKDVGAKLSKEGLEGLNDVVRWQADLASFDGKGGEGKDAIKKDGEVRSGVRCVQG